MNEEAHAALEAAKIRRTQASKVMAKAAHLVEEDQREVQARESKLETLTKERAGFIEAGKIAEVIRVDAEILHARIAVEIARVRTETSARAHAVAIKELREAEAAVAEAARLMLDGEMLDLAAKFSHAFDAALSIGAELSAIALRSRLDMPLASLGQSSLPLKVREALSRLPRPDTRDVPLDILRGTRRVADVYGARLVALTQADEPSAINGDDHG